MCIRDRDRQPEYPHRIEQVLGKFGQPAGLDVLFLQLLAGLPGALLNLLGATEHFAADPGLILGTGGDLLHRRHQFGGALLSVLHLIARLLGQPAALHDLTDRGVNGLSLIHI